ncbi:MAG: hypothetical protein WC292_02135 [Clostridia bacterium]
MIFLKKTFEYLFVLEKGRRFFILFMFSLPIGISAAFMTPTWAFSYWAANYTTGNFNFWDIWNFGANPMVFPIAGAIFLLMTVFFLSVQATIVARSMRVGVFKVNFIFSEFNDSFFPSISSVGLYAVIYLAYKVLTTLFLTLWQAVNSTIISFALSIFSLFLMFVGVCFMLGFVMLFLPLMTITGVRPQNALVASLNKCSKNITGLAFAVALPVLIVNVAGALIGLINIPRLSHMTDSILFSFLATYLFTLTMVSYYEIEQIKRTDYPREFYYKK